MCFVSLFFFLKKKQAFQVHGILKWPFKGVQKEFTNYFYIGFEGLSTGFDGFSKGLKNV